MRRALFALLLLAISLLSLPQTTPAQQGPPMGWNSWDAYGLTITEAQFRANAAVLREKLLPFGYRYAVIDEGWFFFNPEARPHPETLHYSLDANGRYTPVPERFPSAVVKTAPSAEAALPEPTGSSEKPLAATLEPTTFRPLADAMHAQGLLFGIHIVRGIPRASVERNLPIAGSAFHVAEAADPDDHCPWDPTNFGVRDTPAGQAWYDSLLDQYADWGVDLLKVDCIADHPYAAAEIRMIRRALDRATARTHRPMVLSLSPGPTDPAHAEEVSHLAQMWRISNDFWDLWAASSTNPDGFPQSLKGQFDRALPWSRMDLPPGTFPDLDMLPFGALRPTPGWGEPRRSRLTPDEERTVMTLWAMMRSPLILGANLTELEAQTLAILTNRDVIRLDQAGEGGVQIEPSSRDMAEKLPPGIPGLRTWAARVPAAPGRAAARFAALFNTGDVPLTVTRSVADLNLVTARQARRAVAVYDVWNGRSLGRSGRITVTLPAHGVVLLRAGD